MHYLPSYSIISSIKMFNKRFCVFDICIQKNKKHLIVAAAVGLVTTFVIVKAASVLFTVVCVVSAVALIFFSVATFLTYKSINDPLNEVKEKQKTIKLYGAVLARVSIYLITFTKVQWSLGTD